jgi:hypothetical protein
VLGSELFESQIGESSEAEPVGERLSSTVVVVCVEGVLLEGLEPLRGPGSGGGCVILGVVEKPSVEQAAEMRLGGEVLRRVIDVGRGRCRGTGRGEGETEEEEEEESVVKKRSHGRRSRGKQGRRRRRRRRKRKKKKEEEEEEEEELLLSRRWRFCLFHGG